MITKVDKPKQRNFLTFLKDMFFYEEIKSGISSAIKWPFNQVKYCFNRLNNFSPKGFFKTKNFKEYTPKNQKRIPKHEKVQAVSAKIIWVV